MKTQKHILIIGGGIIGLFSAFYLNRAGYRVTILEKNAPLDNCSLGNAGMIVPSHFVPLAAPGMVKKGLRWMFNPESPFYIKPRMDWDLISWGLKFIQAARPEKAEAAIPVLRDLNLESKKLYRELLQENLFDFAFKEEGILMLYKTEKAAEEEGKTAELANQIGIEAQILNRQEVEALDPNVTFDVLGAAYYPGDAHLYPNKLLENLSQYLVSKGVNIVYQTEITDIITDREHILQVKAGDQTYSPDLTVMAAGAWSGTLAKSLGITLPMQGGKGYSLTLDHFSPSPQIPAILTEAKVTVTPMENQLRFAGTLEIAGENLSVNMRRVKGLLSSVSRYYPQIDPEIPVESKVWRGLRPCSPDGLPYIGYSHKYRNLIFATGHAMMGVSLAPVTGKLVSQLVERKNPEILKMLIPERY